MMAWRAHAARRARPRWAAGHVPDWLEQSRYQSNVIGGSLFSMYVLFLIFYCLFFFFYIRKY